MIKIYTYKKSKSQVDLKKRFPVLTPVIQGRFSGEIEPLTNEEILSLLANNYIVSDEKWGDYISQLITYRQEDQSDYNNLNQIADLLNLLPIYNLEELEANISCLYQDRKMPTRQTITDAIYTLYSSRFTPDGIQRLLSRHDFVMDLQDSIHQNFFNFLDRQIAEDAGNLQNKKASDTKKTAQNTGEIQRLQRNLEQKKADKKLLENIFRIEPLTEAIGSHSPQTESIPACLDIAFFTLRHYTTVEAPAFTTIQSALSLAMSDKIKQSTAPGNHPAKSSGHTNNTDWNTFGNIGNTFFLLFIGGIPVCQQPFLKNTKHYTEFPLRQFEHLWISSDWLDKRAVRGSAVYGSGEQIYHYLLNEVRNLCNSQHDTSGGPPAFTDLTPQGFVNILGNMYNNFEVKVPGNVPLNGASWNPSDFSSSL